MGRTMPKFPLFPLAIYPMLLHDVNRPFLLNLKGNHPRLVPQGRNPILWPIQQSEEVKLQDLAHIGQFQHVKGPLVQIISHRIGMLVDAFGKIIEAHVFRFEPTTNQLAEVDLGKVVGIVHGWLDLSLDWKSVSA